MITGASHQRYQMDNLYAQHSLDSDDWQQICYLAAKESARESAQPEAIEEIAQRLESWSFDQLFGFTFHLFITTESQQIREQLVPLLPKFGSRAVMSLIKIAYHFRPASAVSALALQSLTRLHPRTLAIGLVPVMALESAPALMPVIVRALVEIVRTRDEAILSMLAARLPQAQWQQLEQRLFRDSAFVRFQEVLPPQAGSDLRKEEAMHSRNHRPSLQACR